MPKLWDELKPEVKTKLMALRYYLEKKENKKKEKEEEVTCRL